MPSSQTQYNAHYEFVLNDIILFAFLQDHLSARKESIPFIKSFIHLIKKSIDLIYPSNN